MSRSRELIVATSRPQNISVALGTREGSLSYFVDLPHLQAQILPAHVAESLSRGLAIIPLYEEKSQCVDHGSGSILNRPVAFSLDARSTLRRSLFVADEIQTKIGRLLRILDVAGEDITPAQARSSQEQLDKLACSVQITRDAFKQLYGIAGAISQEMSTHVREASVTTVPNWIKAVRIGSICVSLPTFAAAVLSAAWNTTHPMLAFIMAIVSAAAAMCGGMGPCIAQWYWETTRNAPPRADIQAVRVETYRLSYPLSLLLKWWQKLAYMFYTLTLWTPNHRITNVTCELKSIAQLLNQYSREVQVILNSVEGENATACDDSNMV